MKPEIHLPRVYSGKISLGKTMFPRAKVRSVTTAIVFGNCRGTGGIFWLFPFMLERWIFWNHSIRGPNSPPEKHLKCHDKMAVNNYNIH